MFVAQDLAADPQDHRPVAIDQGFKRGLGGFVPTRHEPIEQLAVSEPPGRPRLKQGFDLLEKFHRSTDGSRISLLAIGQDAM